MKVGFGGVPKTGTLLDPMFMSNRCRRRLARQLVPLLRWPWQIKQTSHNKTRWLKVLVIERRQTYEREGSFLTGHICMHEVTADGQTCPYLWKKTTFFYVKNTCLFISLYTRSVLAASITSCYYFTLVFILIVQSQQQQMWIIAPSTIVFAVGGVWRCVYHRCRGTSTPQSAHATEVMAPPPRRQSIASFSWTGRRFNTTRAYWYWLGVCMSNGKLLLSLVQTKKNMHSGCVCFHMWTRFWPWSDLPSCITKDPSAVWGHSLPWPTPSRPPPPGSAARRQASIPGQTVLIVPLRYSVFLGEGQASGGPHCTLAMRVCSIPLVSADRKSAGAWPASSSQCTLIH